MPRRNKNARTRKQKPYHIMDKHKQKLEVEKKVEQQLAYIQRKADEYDRKSKERLRQAEEMIQATHEKSKLTTQILLASCVVGLIVMSLFILWLGR